MRLPAATLSPFPVALVPVPVGDASINAAAGWRALDISFHTPDRASDAQRSAIDRGPQAWVLAMHDISDQPG